MRIFLLSEFDTKWQDDVNQNGLDAYMQQGEVIMILTVIDNDFYEYTEEGWRPIARDESEA